MFRMQFGSVLQVKMDVFHVPDTCGVWLASKTEWGIMFGKHRTERVRNSFASKCSKTNASSILLHPSPKLCDWGCGPRSALEGSLVTLGTENGRNRRKRWIEMLILRPCPRSQIFYELHHTCMLIKGNHEACLSNPHLIGGIHNGLIG